jgi:hypothetical protein
MVEQFLAEATRRAGAEERILRHKAGQRATKLRQKLAEVQADANKSKELKAADDYHLRQQQRMLESQLEADGAELERQVSANKALLAQQKLFWMVGGESGRALTATHTRSVKPSRQV